MGPRLPLIIKYFPPCIYLYMRERERERERETDRQTDRQTDRPTNRQTDRPTENKISWRMLVIKQLMVPIYFHSIYFLTLRTNNWLVLQNSSKYLLLCSTLERNWVNDDNIFIFRVNYSLKYPMLKCPNTFRIPCILNCNTYSTLNAFLKVTFFSEFVPVLLLKVSY